MGLKDLTVEERDKLRQENPEEYEKLAAEDLPKGKQMVRSINGRTVAIETNESVRWVNGRKIG